MTDKEEKDIELKAAWLIDNGYSHDTFEVLVEKMKKAIKEHNEK